MRVFYFLMFINYTITKKIVTVGHVELLYRVRSQHKLLEKPSNSHQ